MNKKAEELYELRKRNRDLENVGVILAILILIFLAAFIYIYSNCYNQPQQQKKWVKEDVWIYVNLSDVYKYCEPDDDGFISVRPFAWIAEKYGIKWMDLDANIYFCINHKEDCDIVACKLKQEVWVRK